MRVVGITGTNGKTTTSYLTSAIFEAAGMQCGLMGTVTYRIGGHAFDATRTTPEAPELQAFMRQMVAAGCGACVMEVSSHALALRRVDGIEFAAAVFTNLTRDHLDFHGDMEDYFAAKRRLFEMLPAGAPAIINADDPRCRRSPDVAAAGRSPTAIHKTADVTPGPLSFSLDGLSFDIGTPAGRVRVESRLVGKPNVYNILAAVATASSLDVPIEAIEKGMRHLPGVPGRFELASTAGDDITVIVDYAHTDDALRNLLETARPMAKRRLITVFGAGGDRDRTKRPLMGMVAARLSDVVVITSDNPRGEDPQRIIDEVKRGADAEDAAEQRRSADDRRSARRDCPGDRPRGEGRRRPHRRQGTREVPGDRRTDAAVRRRRGGAGGAGGAAGEVARRVTRPADARMDCAARAGCSAGGEADSEVGEVVIDSRVVQPGDLFVAIRGPRFDGHDFVGGGADRGAARRSSTKGRPFAFAKLRRARKARR